jgi:glycosyltransferase involved in cell wall biosynthesis
VTFAGLLTGVMKQSALSIADAFILPSHQENFGLSIVEALSSGLPVLISDKVNIWREIVADGAGFVAPDDDAGTLHVLQKWLALSSADVLRMRDAAKKSFETHFRADVSSSKLLTSIRKSISSSHEQSSSSLQFARA